MTKDEYAQACADARRAALEGLTVNEIMEETGVDRTAAEFAVELATKPRLVRAS